MSAEPLEPQLSHSVTRQTGTRKAAEPLRELPARMLPKRSVSDLIQSARASLDAARDTEDSNSRFVHAHVAALRAGAAVVAARATPQPPQSQARRHTGLPSLWVLLRSIAPDLGEWADYFEASAPKRQSAEAGVRNAVSEREASDLMRDSHAFVRIVETALSISPQLRIV